MQLVNEATVSATATRINGFTVVNPLPNVVRKGIVLFWRCPAQFYIKVIHIINEILCKPELH